MFWKLWSAGIPDVVVVELSFPLNFLQLLWELVKNMFPDKIRSFELLPTVGTQPLVLCNLLTVIRYELFNLVCFCFEAWK